MFIFCVQPPFALGYLAVSISDSSVCGPIQKYYFLIVSNLFRIAPTPNTIAPPEIVYRLAATINRTPPCVYSRDLFIHRNRNWRFLGVRSQK